MNLLIDSVPKAIEVNRERYSIRTDFRIWIMFEQLLLDDSVDDSYKLDAAVKLVFGDTTRKPPINDDTVQAILDFYGCGKAVEGGKGKSSAKDSKIYDYVAEGLEVNEYGILNISHNGSRNFCVWIYDQNDRKDLLVNTIGNYNGAVLVNGTGSYTLEIKADGNWSIESQSLSVTDDTTFSGTGDCVTAIVDNAKGSWEISNNGSRNFVVWSHDVFTNDKDLLVNEIGNYTGTVLVKHPNETIFEITSDGNWSIDKR